MAEQINNLSPIAGRIKRFRKRLGYTQSDLAVVAGIDVSNISRLERGNAYPNTQTLIKLAQALEITPNDLLLEVNDPPLLMNEEIAVQASSLSSADKSKVLEYIAFLKFLSGSFN